MLGVEDRRATTRRHAGERSPTVRGEVSMMPSMRRKNCANVRLRSGTGGSQEAKVEEADGRGADCSGVRPILRSAAAAPRAVTARCVTRRGDRSSWPARSGRQQDARPAGCWRR